MIANNKVIAGKCDVPETSLEDQAALALQAEIALEEKIVEVADRIYAPASNNDGVDLQARSHFTLSMRRNNRIFFHARRNDFVPADFCFFIPA